MKQQVPLTPVLAVALVIVVAVAYFAVLRPKQDKGARLDDQIAELETKLAGVSRESKSAAPKVKIDVADIFRLAKAMPDNEEMPATILELNSIALSTGVHFIAIQPGTPVVKESYQALPVTLTFEGNYYDLTDFLYRLRNLVTVRDGVLDASGRLYTLDALQMKQGSDPFGQIDAVLTVSAYTFGAPPQPAPGATGTPPATTAPATTAPATTATTQTTTTAGTTADGSQQAAGGGG